MCSFDTLEGVSPEGSLNLSHTPPGVQEELVLGQLAQEWWDLVCEYVLLSISWADSSEGPGGSSPGDL